jgi:hypothetical protein
VNTRKHKVVTYFSSSKVKGLNNLTVTGRQAESITNFNSYFDVHYSSMSNVLWCINLHYMGKVECFLWLFWKAWDVWLTLLRHTAEWLAQGVTNLLTWRFLKAKKVISCLSLSYSLALMAAILESSATCSSGNTLCFFNRCHSVSECLQIT